MRNNNHVVQRKSTNPRGRAYGLNGRVVVNRQQRQPPPPASNNVNFRIKIEFVIYPPNFSAIINQIRKHLLNGKAVSSKMNATMKINGTHQQSKMSPAAAGTMKMRIILVVVEDGTMKAEGEEDGTTLKLRQFVAQINPIQIHATMKQQEMIIEMFHNRRLFLLKNFVNPNIKNE